MRKLLITAAIAVGAFFVAGASEAKAQSIGYFGYRPLLAPRPLVPVRVVPVLRPVIRVGPVFPILRAWSDTRLYYGSRYQSYGRSGWDHRDFGHSHHRHYRRGW